MSLEGVSSGRWQREILLLLPPKPHADLEREQHRRLAAAGRAPHRARRAVPLSHGALQRGDGVRLVRRDALALPRRQARGVARLVVGAREPHEAQRRRGRRLGLDGLHSGAVTTVAAAAAAFVTTTAAAAAIAAATAAVAAR